MPIYISIVIILLLSAFFSASEIAFISADRLRIELDKAHQGWYARMQSVFFSAPGQFITTMLVGNNIALVIYGLLMAKLLEPPLHVYISNPFVVVLCQTIISTILILIFGEFIPKAVSKLNPNSQIKTFAIPLFILYILLYPIAAFTTWLSNIFFKLLRIADANNDSTRLGRVDLDNYIESNAQDEEAHNTSEVKILQNALDFPDVKVRDCFVPRNEIIACDRDNTTKEQLIQIFDRTGFSKILIYNDSIDDICGYIHAIEMFQCRDDWRNHINTTLYIPETISAAKAMRLLMQSKKSIAVVVDELGGTAGMITLEDIVEEIFGDIEDEHDIPSVVVRRVNNNEYIFSGRAEIDNLNEQFELGLPTSDEYKTIAGMILHHLQSFPNKGDEFIISQNFKIKILRATDSKINLVKVTLLPLDQAN